MEATGTTGGSAAEAVAAAAEEEEIGAACPIADALGPIRRSRAGDRNPAAGTFRVDAVETLATLLDLTGSMALAVELESPSASGGARPSGLARSGTAELAEVIRLRFDQLGTAVERRLAELPTSRSAIWGAERMTAELKQRNLVGARRGRALATLAREASDSYVLAMRGLLDRIRGDLRGLRIEIGPRLARCGPRVARLEAFDTLVTRARSAATHRLIGRIPSALADDFAARLEAAVGLLDRGLLDRGLLEKGRPEKALPENEAPESAIAAWYARDGWVDRFQGDAARVIRGVFAHERTALVELVAAARDLEGEGASGGKPSDGDVAHTIMHTEAGGIRP